MPWAFHLLASAVHCSRTKWSELIAKLTAVSDNEKIQSVAHRNAPRHVMKVTPGLYWAYNLACCYIPCGSALVIDLIDLNLVLLSLRASSDRLELGERVAERFVWREQGLKLWLAPMVE